MTEGTFTLPDIPDLSGIQDTYSNTGDKAPFVDGWYEADIVEKRVLTNKAGNELEFASGDAPSQAGDSRNIKLQMSVKRQSDGRELGTGYLLNYRPEYLTQETVQQINAFIEQVKTGAAQWKGSGMFRPFKALKTLGTLQKVAGVRQFSRTEEGGLNLAPLFGKKIWVRLGPDEQKPQYKAILDVRDTKPTKNVY